MWSDFPLQFGFDNWVPLIKDTIDIVTTQPEVTFIVTMTIGLSLIMSFANREAKD